MKRKTPGRLSVITGMMQKTSDVETPKYRVIYWSVINQWVKLKEH